MVEHRYNEIRPDKRKGQHILTDNRTIEKQIGYANLKGTETVLEIGSGPGNLTIPLSESARKVIAIEKDRRFVTYLKDKIPENVELIHADVMKVDLPEFDVAVANLPYQISSPVTFKLLGSKFQRAVLMYQKEFAQRMAAKANEPGYSRLSVNIFYRSKCSILEYVPKSAFSPPPEVDSAIVGLIPRPPPFQVENERLFFELVEALFAQRRKKIKNTLVAFIAKRTKLEKAKIRKIIDEIEVKDHRVENLTPQQIGVLSDMVSGSNKNSPQ